MKKWWIAVIAAVLILGGAAIWLSLASSAVVLPDLYVYYTNRNFSTLTGKNAYLSSFRTVCAVGNGYSSDGSVDANGRFSFDGTNWSQDWWGMQNTSNGSGSSGWWAAPVACYGETVAVNEFVVPTIGYTGNFATHNIWYTDDYNGVWKKAEVTAQKVAHDGTYADASWGYSNILVYRSEALLKGKYFMLTTGSENVYLQVNVFYAAYNPDLLRDGSVATKVTKLLPSWYGDYAYPHTSTAVPTSIPLSSISWESADPSFRNYQFCNENYHIPFLKFSSPVTINEIVMKVIRDGKFNPSLGFQVYALENGAWSRVNCTYIFDTRPGKYQYGADGSTSTWLPKADIVLTFDRNVTSDTFMIYCPGITTTTHYYDTGNNILFQQQFFYGVLRETSSDLTVSVSGVRSSDTDSSFLFTIQGEVGTAVSHINLKIMVNVDANGTGNVTIADLPVGNYIVTEHDGWSWRYGSIPPVKVDLRTEDTASFSFSHVSYNDKWLSDQDHS